MGNNCSYCSDEFDEGFSMISTLEKARACILLGYGSGSDLQDIAAEMRGSAKAHLEKALEKSEEPSQKKILNYALQHLEEGAVLSAYELIIAEKDREMETLSDSFSKCITSCLRAR